MTAHRFSFLYGACGVCLILEVDHSVHMPEKSLNKRRSTIPPRHRYTHTVAHLHTHHISFSLLRLVCFVGLAFPFVNILHPSTPEIGNSLGIKNRKSWQSLFNKLILLRWSCARLRLILYPTTSLLLHWSRVR